MEILQELIMRVTWVCDLSLLPLSINLSCPELWNTDFWCTCVFRWIRCWSADLWALDEEGASIQTIRERKVVESWKVLARTNRSECQGNGMSDYFVYDSYVYINVTASKLPNISQE